MSHEKFLRTLKLVERCQVKKINENVESFNNFCLTLYKMNDKATLNGSKIVKSICDTNEKS